MNHNMGHYSSIVSLLYIVQIQKSTRRRPCKKLLSDTISGSQTKSVLLGVYKYNQESDDHQSKHYPVSAIISIQNSIWCNIATGYSKNTNEDESI